MIAKTPTRRALEPKRLAWLDEMTLDRGSHRSRADGACVMEAVAYVARERWSDHPACVSPVIAAFLRSWNDALDHAGRQVLKPYVVRVVGTRTTDADEQARAWLATDWLVRTFTPASLDLAGLTEDAAALRALPEMTSTDLARAAMPVIESARKSARAARAAARDAAWDAVRAAARDAARDAAWAAAWDAAWAAAWAAAWDAAWDALAPTVAALQRSALDLLDRMISVGEAAR